MIPPPILQSTYAPNRNARAPAKESAFVEKPSDVDERQQHLEADLQFLLDAQAEGLVRGLGGRSIEERSSTGSTTPTAQITQSTSARRTRRPLRRQPGLKSARKGIYNSIVALASLKDEELFSIDAKVHENEQTIEQIDVWKKKRAGLREASLNLDASEDTIRAQRLQQEADAIQVEINQVEIHLNEMKSKHRKIMQQAAAVENSVQAKMASYSSSLQQLEEDVQKFLSLQPDNIDPISASSGGKASIWQLPRKRRNLDLAKEYWMEQRESTLQQKTSIEFERSALVDGANLWREAVAEISSLEKELHVGMSQLPSSPGSNSAWDEPVETDAPGNLRQLLGKMEIVKESLRVKLQSAEERNWRLLVAALGAEADALQRGEEILLGALQQVLGEEEDAVVLKTDGHEAAQSLQKTDSGEEIRTLDQSFMTTRPANHSDGEDDEPPPELLFSQARDIDTE